MTGPFSRLHQDAQQLYSVDIVFHFVSVCAGVRFVCVY